VVIEPIGPESQPSASAGRTSRRRPVGVVALILIAAITSGLVAAGVTLGVLQMQSRTNPQTLNLGSNVTISEDSAVTQVAARAVPAVVSVVTQDTGTTVSYGSGFLITSDGYIVTNLHVIANAPNLTVLFNNDPKSHPARVVDYDCQMRFAVLKVDQVSRLPTLALGDSSALKLGQTVVAVSGPLDRHSVARGIISAIHRDITVSDPLRPTRDLALSGTVQTTAPMTTGTSGGPLLNVAGQVVGVSVVALSGGDRVSFALSSVSIQPPLEQIVQTGQLIVPSVGATYTDLDTATAALRELPPGGLIRSVEPGGPADRAGIRPGDVVTQLNELRVDSAHPLGELLRAQLKPSQRVAVTFWHNGASSQVQLVLVGEHPSCL
jgi:S1-C subfamily serine protease